MDVWADLLHSNLETNGVIIYLLAKYVDDVNIATSIIQKGYSWEKRDGGWRLIWTEERLNQDQQQGLSDMERTLELIREVGDNLVPGLKLTKDLPEYHENGKCPVLDIQVWLSPLVFH